MKTDSAKATSRHIRGSSLLLAGRGLSAGLNFVIQVLMVRYLTKADYGAFAYGLAVAAFGSSLVAVGLDKAASRFVPIFHERRDYGRLFGTLVLALGTMLGLGIALTLGVWGVQGLIAGSVVRDPLAASLLVILIALAPLEALDRLLGKMVVVFTSPRAVFVRRHVLAPTLKLTAVLWVIGLEADVRSLALAHVAAGIAGIALYAWVLIRALKAMSLWQHLGSVRIKFPAGQIFRYGLPVSASDAMWLLRGSVAVFLLEYFHATHGVAEYRAIVPVAGMNKVVFDSFRFMFIPVASRLLARRDWAGINNLYWATSAWIAMLSFPLFAVCFALAEPVTTILFGSAYAGCGQILALLSVGYFINVSLGFNSETLKVLGKVKLVLLIDITSFLAFLVLSILFIIPFGPVGAAAGMSAGLIFYNVLNQWALVRTGVVEALPRSVLGLSFSIVAAVVALLGIQWLLSPPGMVGLMLAAAASVVVLYLNHHVLQLAAMFPELERLPLLRQFLRAPNKTTPVGPDLRDGHGFVRGS